jgi:hypothetical protein
MRRFPQEVLTSEKFGIVVIMNCTPIVRQYDLLITIRVFFYAEEDTPQKIHTGIVAREGDGRYQLTEKESEGNWRSVIDGKKAGCRPY